MKHNNSLSSPHLRKHWSRFVRTWFNQPSRKIKRSTARKQRALATFPRPLEKLRPLVRGCTKKYNSKIRYGRGFTLDELKKAKLTPKFARTVGIAVDHRRQDTNEETYQLNVQRLENYKSKLILFPRRAAKPKKGEINDSTAEKLKSTAATNQNKQSYILPKTVESQQEKP